MAVNEVPPDIKEQRRRQRQAETEEVHRAIGRYVVSFSMMLFRMRQLMTGVLDSGLAHLAFGQATADQISTAFFGMCREQVRQDERELDADELKVATELTKAVKSTISDRNDFAHGDWLIGAETDAPRLTVLKILRIHPMRAAGAVKTIDLTVADIDKRCDDIATLTHGVVVYGSLCIGPMRHFEPDMRVRDLLIIEEGAVRYNGPRASEINIL